MAIRPVYSQVIYRQAGCSGIPFTFSADLPEGVEWVIRSVDCYGNLSDFEDAQFVLSEQLTTAAFVFFNWTLGEQNAKHWEGRQVIPQGPDVGTTGIHVQVDGGPIDISISGYALTLP